MSLTEQILATVPGQPLNALQMADQRWSALKHGDLTVPVVIGEQSTPLSETDWDVVICGGTLGILLGATLQRRGWHVALLERGVLRGRDQEWNISRQELSVFLDLGLLSPVELEQAIATQYNPARVGFYQGPEVWVKDVLNIGVDPVCLLATLKEKFLAAGGQLFEQTPFTKATVHSDGVLVEASGSYLKTRLLIDAMGHFSAIAAQARQGQKPEGVCVVMGSCAKGYPQNTTGDLIYSFTPIQDRQQYFWEAFPAQDGRTTYMFTYLDAQPERPSLQDFMENYLRLLPQYQQVELSNLDFVRFLFGFFPSYRSSPLRPVWDRILFTGDSAGAQSPVSFGGFGAMVRHLQRLTIGIEEALKIDALDRQAIAQLHPYQPNISVTWLFQRSMSVGLQQELPPNQINQLMSGVFQVMERLGDPVLKPFLQDVIQFRALACTLISVNPLLALPMLPQLGLPLLLDWSRHFINLGLYRGLYSLVKLAQPLERQLSPRQQYVYHRWLDAWQYGSGGDYSA